MILLQQISLGGWDKGPTKENEKKPVLERKKRWKVFS